MAFSQIQKVQILRHIGWPEKYISPNTPFYSNQIINKLNDVSEYTESEALTLLDRINEIDVELRSAVKRTKVSNLENIQLNPNEFSLLRTEKRRIIGELQILVTIYPPRHYGFELG